MQCIGLVSVYFLLFLILWVRWKLIFFFSTPTQNENDQFVSMATRMNQLTKVKFKPNWFNNSLVQFGGLVWILSNIHRQHPMVKFVIPVEFVIRTSRRKFLTLHFLFRWWKCHTITIRCQHEQLHWNLSGDFQKTNHLCQSL